MTSCDAAPIGANIERRSAVLGLARVERWRHQYRGFGSRDVDGCARGSGDCLCRELFSCIDPQQQSLPYRLLIASTGQSCVVVVARER